MLLLLWMVNIEEAFQNKLYATTHAISSSRTYYELRLFLRIFFSLVKGYGADLAVCFCFSGNCNLGF